MIKDSSSLVRVAVGDTIKEGDYCKTITGEYIPANASIGRKVKSWEYGYVWRRETRR